MTSPKQLKVERHTCMHAGGTPQLSILSSLLSPVLLLIDCFRSLHTQADFSDLLPSCELEWFSKFDGREMYQGKVGDFLHNNLECVHELVCALAPLRLLVIGGVFLIPACTVRLAWYTQLRSVHKHSKICQMPERYFDTR